MQTVLQSKLAESIAWRWTHETKQKNRNHAYNFNASNLYEIKTHERPLWSDHQIFKAFSSESHCASKLSSKSAQLERFSSHLSFFSRFDFALVLTANQFRISNKEIPANVCCHVRNCLYWCFIAGEATTDRRELFHYCHPILRGCVRKWTCADAQMKRSDAQISVVFLSLMLGFFCLFVRWFCSLF